MKQRSGKISTPLSVLSPKARPQRPSIIPDQGRVTAVQKPVEALNQRLLTAEQVAEITGLSIETLAQWRSQRRRIPFVKISRNVVRYRQGDLDAWLTEHLVPVEST